MYTNIIFLIIFAALWSGIEIFLIVKDKVLSKGTVTIDRNSRFLNVLSVTISLFSPLIMFIIPRANISNHSLFALLFIGLLTLLSGMFVRYWAICTLGNSFRTTVEIETEQKIIETGPYKFIRHPAYTGIILFCIGYGLLSQNWLSLLISLLLPASALLYRIHIEEQAFVDIIGDEYRKYQLKTKKLIPWVW